MRFPAWLIEATANDPTALEAMVAQRALFDTRAKALEDRKDILRRRIEQLREEIAGLVSGLFRNRGGGRQSKPWSQGSGDVSVRSFVRLLDYNLCSMKKALQIQPMFATGRGVVTAVDQSNRNPRPRRKDPG